MDLYFRPSRGFKMENFIQKNSTEGRGDDFGTAEAWGKLQALARSLEDFIKSHKNVHVEVKTLAKKIVRAVKEVAVNRPPAAPVTVECIQGATGAVKERRMVEGTTQTLPLGVGSSGHAGVANGRERWTQTSPASAGTVAASPSQGARTPNDAGPSRPKKKRTPPSIERESREKVRKTLTLPSPAVDGTEWVKVVGRRKAASQRKGPVAAAPRRATAAPETGKRSTRPRPDHGKKAGSTSTRARRKRGGRLPDAIIIRRKEEGPAYADILKGLKADPRLKEVSQRVSRIARTLAGDVIMVLGSKEGPSTLECGDALRRACGDAAGVTVKVPEDELELRNIDEFTSADELGVAVRGVLGDGTEPDGLRMRKGHGGAQIARLKLPVETAARLVEMGKLKVGWSVVTVRRVEARTRCYKCWSTGHLAIKCQSKVDRTGMCYRCGQEGHRVGECSNEPLCVLCPEASNRKHVAGGPRCPATRGPATGK